jgi:hypothetical protein
MGHSQLGRGQRPAPRKPTELGSSTFRALYPTRGHQRLRHVKGERNNIISYGLEGELNLSKAPALLDWYRPPQISDAQWLHMSRSRQLAAAGRGDGMVKTSRAPAWLMDKTEKDPGGMEIITKPVRSLEQAFSIVREVERKLGPRKVYWQGNVGFERYGTFARDNKDGLMGYLMATADYAQLGKLYRGYRRHLKIPKYIPGANLGHGILGPMNQEVVAELTDELGAAARGIATSRNQHYLQGTYFRTRDYGKHHNGFEIRDPHKDLMVLRREMRRLTHGLEGGFAPYASFKDLTMLRSNETHAPHKILKLRDTHFSQLPVRAQRLLSTLKIRGHKNYAERYALPLRPFEREYPAALGLKGQDARRFDARVKSARQAYLATLERLATGYRGAFGEVDVRRLLGEVRIALGRFAYDSGIYTALDRHFAEIGSLRPAAPSHQTAGR